MAASARHASFPPYHPFLSSLWYATRFVCAVAEFSVETKWGCPRRRFSNCSPSSDGRQFFCRSHISFAFFQLCRIDSGSRLDDVSGKDCRIRRAKPVARYCECDRGASCPIRRHPCESLLTLRISRPPAHCNFLDLFVGLLHSVSLIGCSFGGRRSPRATIANTASSSSRMASA